MKKILLGILLGLVLHKVMFTAYSYSWWSAEASKECRAVHQGDQIFKCIYDRMGYMKYLGYPLANLEYTYQEWHWEN